MKKPKQKKVNKTEVEKRWGVQLNSAGEIGEIQKELDSVGGFHPPSATIHLGLASYDESSRSTACNRAKAGRTR
jgi:hypothetical protein